MPKTISDKYAESLDQIKTLEGQLVELKESADKVPALEKQVTDLQAEINDLTETAEKAKTEHEAAVKERDDKITALKASEAKLRGQLAMSPGHIQAGGTDPVTEQGGNSGEGPATKEEALEAYGKIKDAKEQEAFRAKHADLLGLKIG